MKQTMTAVYENGVFRPLESPGVAEGERVRLTVETRAEASAEDLLELAARVYEGLTQQEIAEVEQIALDRRRFFRDGAK